MHVLMTISIFVLTETSAQIEYSINVGTVLFSRSDIQKNQWSTNEIGLLRARRHFQDLLPPPNFIDTSNENYINTLLNYFKHTFSTIKREATCPVSDSLMTTAFSDALGGYMKLWVLPISKLAFYGGSVSQKNIVKLYQFHNEIKRFLETDGKGWRTPDKTLLNSITLNIAPPAHITRSMKNPCENFAYYEKIGGSLSIPIPYVDWGSTTGTMFLPLRNQSLIPLDSPSNPNALFKYYDAAKNCIDDSANGQNYEFDNRFQTWLSTDVVPHLSDDTVYLPLGSVLSLVNRSREMCDKVIDLYSSQPKTIHTHYVIAGIPVDLSSKKNLFIGIILILEIAWCIPALLYLLCSRKKKKKESRNVYTLLDACRNRGNKGDKGKGFFQIKSRNNPSNRGFKIGNRPRSENVELETKFIPSDSKGTIATDTHSYFGSGVCSGVSVIHETRPTPPLKSSMKKIRSARTTPAQQPINASKSNKTCPSKKLDKCRPSDLSIRTESYTIENNTDASTVFSSVKQINIPIDTVSNTTHVKSSCNVLQKSKSKDVPLHQCPTQDLSVECPCLTCLEAEVGSEITIINQESKPCLACSDKNVEINMEPLNPLIKQVKYGKKANVGLRLESGRPYLEIKIDKPQAEICVGIGGTFDPLKLSRRSKIPKRLPKTTAALMTTSTSPMTKESLMTYRNKSHIPQPKKRPIDDIVIKSSKTKQKRKENKLNVTL